MNQFAQCVVLVGEQRSGPHDGMLVAYEIGEGLPPLLNLTEWIGHHFVNVCVRHLLIVPKEIRIGGVSFPVPEEWKARAAAARRAATGMTHAEATTDGDRPLQGQAEDRATPPAAEDRAPAPDGSGGTQPGEEAQG